MLIVRGVNVFPSALREVVSGFAPDVSGHIVVRPRADGVKQEPPLPVAVELAQGVAENPALADAIRERIRNVLVVQTRVDLVPWGALRRSEYKSRLVEHQIGVRVRKLQVQGVHHITLVGAGRQTSIGFWEGVLGMPFVFEQPNLDNASESHLYFDPGDGRLITVFANEDRESDPERTPTDPGCVHHLAFAVSKATFDQVVERLDERGIRHSGPKDRGFMDSIYFEDPLGLLIELAAYRFEPPNGHTHTDVLLEAHKIRVERGDHNIAQVHLADAIEALVKRSQASLSDRRSPEDPYQSLPVQGG
jgi:catechol 2,3-dioxygenase-like lactoylglutathione lyase family enzyme